MNKIKIKNGKYVLVDDKGNERILTLKEVTEIRNRAIKAKLRKPRIKRLEANQRRVNVMDAERERRFDEACARIKSNQSTVVKTASGRLVLNKTKSGVSMRQMYLEEQGYEFD